VAPFAQKRMLAHWKDPNYTTGRPSQYRPEYCDMVTDYMAKGYSLTAFAGTIRQARDTVYEWMTAHSDFSDAVSRGRAARVAALETKLLAARYGAQCSAAIFALKNADPMEWRDMRSVQHDHNVRVDTLTDAQLFAIASGKPMSDAATIDGECKHIETS